MSLKILDIIEFHMQWKIKMHELKISFLQCFFDRRLYYKWNFTQIEIQYCECIKIE